MITRFHQMDLARRWRVSPRTPERWRGEGRDPAYLKIGGRVIYRLEDIEAYEKAQRHCPTSALSPSVPGVR